MKRSSLSRVAGTALAAALTAFAATPSLASQAELPSHDGSTLQPNTGPVAPAWYAADGGYGSQGFHHGLPDPSGDSKSDVFAVDMIPYGVAPDSAAAPLVEPVAGGAAAMRDASILTDTPDAD